MLSSNLKEFLKYGFGDGYGGYGYGDGYGYGSREGYGYGNDDLKSAGAVDVIE